MSTIACNKASPKVIIIDSIWPEPQSSAAGLRTWNILETFLKASWVVHFASPSKENQFSNKLTERGIEIYTVHPNQPQFDDFIAQQKYTFVIFNRFITEEQFGWRFQENSPDTIRILDTLDLHFLRRGRQAALNENRSLDEIINISSQVISGDTLRELASIYRSDCSLIISSFEVSLLTNTYKIDPRILFLNRLHYKTPQKSPSFEERRDFVMIGNFRHPPNYDGITWFQQEIWPLIRQKLPLAKAFIYGAYPPKEMMNLTDKNAGFYVEGPAQDQYKLLEKYRINLAPLRFGAGIKGKISDGWWSGTPVVTTAIGSEGMSDDLPWGGEIANNPEGFAQYAVELHQRKDRWLKAQENGYRLIHQLYMAESNSISLLNHLIELSKNRDELRRSNITGQILSHHHHKSTKYFSKWIEEKNRSKI